jgi:hypothetical protein
MAKDQRIPILKPFKIVIAVTVQNVFRLEMYQNNFFLFLKIIFDISTYLKTYKKIHFKLKKQKKFKIFGNTVCTAFPNTPLGSVGNTVFQKKIFFMFSNRFDMLM